MIQSHESRQSQNRRYVQILPDSNRLYLSVYPDRFSNGTKSAAAEQVRQSQFDRLDHAGAFVDERGVKLDQGRAGADVQPCILGRRDAADADDRDFSASVRMDVANQLARTSQQRPAAESTRMR